MNKKTDKARTLAKEKARSFRYDPSLLALLEVMEELMAAIDNLQAEFEASK